MQLYLNPVNHLKNHASTDKGKSIGNKHLDVLFKQPIAVVNNEDFEDEAVYFLFIALSYFKKLHPLCNKTNCEPPVLQNDTILPKSGKIIAINA